MLCPCSNQNQILFLFTCPCRVMSFAGAQLHSCHCNKNGVGPLDNDAKLGYEYCKGEHEIHGSKFVLTYFFLLATRKQERENNDDDVEAEAGTRPHVVLHYVHYLLNSVFVYFTFTFFHDDNHDHDHIRIPCHVQHSIQFCFALLLFSH